MINSLYLENLKCFESLRLELAPLTLLTGFNAAGKSTALQALLLLAQSVRSRRGIHELRLNGPLASLGNPADVLNGGGAKSITLGASRLGTDLRWQFRLDEKNRRSLVLHELLVQDSEGTRALTPSDLYELGPNRLTANAALLNKAIDRTAFLSAARQVENEVFPIPTEAAYRTGDVGTIGQFAPWWLYEEGHVEVGVQRRSPAAPSAETLRLQLNAWCGELFPGAEINAQPVAKTSLMRLELRSGPTADWSTPANIGFGISYAFPILLAGLLAPEAPLILDSPEAHLHPRGQSRIGGFLAQMAAAGSQILIETHSDHLLNGVRLALRSGTIRPDQVIIYFFAPRPEARVTRLSVDKNGNISDWPEGFFDQSEKDLANLAGWA